MPLSSPHFDYAHVVYDAAYETNKSRLQKLQTRAARLISGTGPRDSRNPVVKELGWLSLENRRCMHKCTMVFKCRNGLAPPYHIDSLMRIFLITATTQDILLNSEYP